METLLLAAPDRPAVASPQIWSYRWAIVAFEDRTGSSLLHLLAPGFRHCFCVLGDGDRWTMIDPLKARIEFLTFTGCSRTELLRHLAACGRRLLVGRINGAARDRTSLWRPLTCVEIVKRAIEIDAPEAFTPHQLHAVLLRRYRFAEHRLGPPDQPLTATINKNNVRYTVNIPQLAVSATGVLDDGPDAGSHPQGIPAGTGA